jgi:hypothetical protein
MFFGLNDSDMTQDEYNERAAISGSGCAMGIIAVLLMLLLCLCGCKTTETIREVPVITEHTTVQHHTDIVRDTLYQRDSVYHYVMGDTVIIERWHHTVKVNKVAVTDTVRDTIPKVVSVTRTEIKEVTRLHWWQHALMWIGGVLLVCGGIILFNKSR